MKRETKIKWVMFVLLLVAIYILIRYFNMTHYLKDPSLLRETVASFGIIAPLIFILIYSIGTVLLFSGLILSVSAGILFGTILGTLYVLIGAGLGATAGFYLARYFGRNTIDKILKKKFKKLNKYNTKLTKDGFFAVLLLRLIIVIPFGMLNYVLGLTKVRYKKYISATLLGILPATFIYVYFGDSLAELNKVSMIISGILIVILLAVVWVYERHRLKKHLA